MSGSMETNVTLENGIVCRAQVHVVRVPGFVRTVSMWRVVSNLERS